MKHTLRTFVATYGTYEIGWGGFDGARRVDRYTPNDGSRPVVQRPVCLDDKDDSPPCHTYAAQLGKTGEDVRPYDSRCPGCALGFQHTVAYHDRRIKPTSKEVLEGT
jgi:hypothetical protein